MRHRMIVLNREGDFRIEWDPKEEAEIEWARAEFENLRKRGYVAFPSDGGVRLDSFDPKPKEILMVPRLVGG